MAIIEHALIHSVRNGEEILFKASCDSSEATGLEITYPVDEYGTKQTKRFAFVDAHGNNLSNQANLFVTGAYVKAVVDTKNKVAYIQNADTNGYLEEKLASIENQQIYTGEISTTWTGDAAPFSQNVTISGLLTEDNPIVDLVPSSDYDVAEREIADYGKLYKMTTAVDTLTVYATEKTTTALNIQLAVMR